MGRTQETKQKLEDRIAQRVLEAMEQENLTPWEQAWAYDPKAVARNYCTARPYRGINVLLTEMTRRAMGYGDPRWMTYRQAQSMGRQVRRGERSTMIVFWKADSSKRDRKMEEQLETGEAVTADDITVTRYAVRRAPLARAYNVFNVEQTDGEEPLEQEGEQWAWGPEEPTQAAEAIIAGWTGKPEIAVERGNAPPRYLPRLDKILVPSTGRWEQSGEYYTAVFHELVHATGHKSRLNRALSSWDNMHDYGREEMVAGMGAAMLAGRAGFRELSVDKDAAYVEHWRRVIQADRSAVIYATQKAQQACDLILNEGHSQAGNGGSGGDA